MMHSKDVTGLVKQILTELPRLQIESHQKLSVLTETGEVVYQCRLSECAFQCKTIDKLERHQNEVHVSSIVSISAMLKSNYQFPDKDKIDLNYFVHVYLKKCNICDVRFDRSGDLFRHIRTIHGKLRFNCDYPICSRRRAYPRRDKYIGHLRSAHKEAIGALKYEQGLIQHWRCQKCLRRGSSYSRYCDTCAASMTTTKANKECEEGGDFMEDSGEDEYGDKDGDSEEHTKENSNLNGESAILHGSTDEDGVFEDGHIVTNKRRRTPRNVTREGRRSNRRRVGTKVKQLAGKPEAISKESHLCGQIGIVRRRPETRHGARFKPQEKAEARECQVEEGIAPAEAFQEATEQHDLKELNEAAQVVAQASREQNVASPAPSIMDYQGQRYERSEKGLFPGLLVAAQLLKIDGEDYVEYRVLSKPSI